MAYTPLAGKLGRITIGAVNRNFREWRLSLSADLVNVDRFEKTVGAVDGAYWKEFLVGFVEGEVTLRGRFDSDARPMATGGAGANGIFPGSSQASVFLGYTSAIGYTITGFVTRVETGTEAGDAGEFSITLKVASVTYPAPT